MAGLLFGYDTAVINGALMYLRVDFHLGAFGMELTAAVLLWGCVIGAALAGYLSDHYGRRAVLSLAGVLFCGSALGAALSTQLWHLLTARALGGVAVGAASLITPLYLAEIAPAQLRGRFVTLTQLAIVTGILITFVSNYRLVQLPTDNWRWMFGLGAIPAVALSLSLLWIPESPRWLVQQGMSEDARAVLSSISSPGSVEAAITEIETSISQETGTYRELLTHALRKPLILTILLAMIQQVTGINNVLYYGALIFAEHTGSGISQSIGINVVIGLVNLLCTVVSILLIDRLGRRPLLLGATGGMGLSLTVFAGMLRWMPTNTLLLTIPLLCYVGFFAVGLGPGVWVCLAEFFPNRIRGRAMSVAAVVLWLTVSLVTATFLSLVQRFTASGVFLGYAALCAASYIYIYSNVPETKNRTLEQIERSWQTA